MKVSDAFPSKYLKSDDVGAQRILVTVMAVTMEDIGDKEFKPVMRFMGKDKGMVLNKTNAMICSTVWGDEMDTWQGKQLEIFAQPVMFQGRQVMGITVAPMLQPAQAQPQSAPQAPVNSPLGDQMQKLADDIAGAEQAANTPVNPADDIPF